MLFRAFIKSRTRTKTNIHTNKKKTNSVANQLSNPNKDQYNPLEKIAINVLREVLLNDLREDYSKKKSSLKAERLKLVYGSQFNTTEGLLEIIEEFCQSEKDVFTDPIFIKLNDIYSKRIEQITEKRLPLDDKEKLKELDKRYTQLMEEIDFIGQRKKELKRNYSLRNSRKRRKRDRSLDSIDPSDKELRRIEKELEK